MAEWKVICAKVTAEGKGWGVWFRVLAGGEGILYQHFDHEPNFKPGNTYGCLIAP